MKKPKTNLKKLMIDFNSVVMDLLHDKYIKYSIDIKKEKFYIEYKHDISFEDWLIKCGYAKEESKIISLSSSKNDNYGPIDMD